jgi:predicted DNA-binding transcriptional regulator YafY
MNIKRKDVDAVRWDQLLRFRLIEVIALWEGRLTSNHLTASFQLGRQQASRDIQAYLKAQPDNLEYDSRLKGYKPTTRFKAAYTQGVADEYLHLLANNRSHQSAVEQLSLPYSPSEVLSVPPRYVEPEVIRALVRACSEGRRLEVCYSSMTTPEGEDRLIAPHALVFNGFRWHVRAFCEKNQDYRDFVLSRIINTPEVEELAINDPADDSWWHNQVEVKLIPNPHLTDPQQALVARDYGLHSNQPPLKTRAALVQYALDLLQITLVDEDMAAKPQQYPVVLANRDELEQYLFKG